MACLIWNTCMSGHTFPTIHVNLQHAWGRYTDAMCCVVNEQDHDQLSLHSRFCLQPASRAAGRCLRQEETKEEQDNFHSATGQWRPEPISQLYSSPFTITETDFADELPLIPSWKSLRRLFLKHTTQMYSPERSWPCESTWPKREFKWASWILMSILVDVFNSDWETNL